MSVDKKEVAKTTGIIIAILAGIFLFIAIIFIVQIIYLGHLLSSGDNPVKSDKEELVEKFNNNYGEFDSVAKYIKESNNQDESNSMILYINKDKDGNYLMGKHTGEDIIKCKIEDKNISKDVEDILNKLKFKSIEIKQNEIYFVYDTGFGKAQGIVYSTDGNEPKPYNPRDFDKIKDLWYYCESEGI